MKNVCMFLIILRQSHGQWAHGSVLPGYAGYDAGEQVLGCFPGSSRTQHNLDIDFFIFDAEFVLERNGLLLHSSTLLVLLLKVETVSKCH
jgi:hypothetical protein